MDEKTKQKYLRLKTLMEQRDRIDAEISEILSPERVIALPANFLINNEVLQVVKEAGDNGISKADILHTLQKKYPSYGIDRRRVASSLAYLKNTKKQVDIVGRGVYKAIENAI